MDFTLTYEGPLATNGRPSQKHQIRLALHPQLKELWGHSPLLQFYDNGGPANREIGGKIFDSIVHPQWGFIATLDILLLRPEPPGGLISQGGDIDNRLKTLLDALTIPTQSQDLPKNWDQSPDDTPLHCLLEDDRLVTGISVRTDRLLAASTPTHVKLFVRVQVTNSRAFGGLAILG